MAQARDEFLLESAVQIAGAAGREILQVYGSGNLQVEYKSDDSPLTAADRRANHLIVSRLTELTPQIPLLSEESAPESFSTRRDWQTLWLVDPLDGTREFIKRNGEFTVNIALIRHGRPVLGVVHVPVQQLTYAGLVAADGQSGQAWKQTVGGLREPIRARPMATGPNPQLAVVASRSHRDAHLDQLLGRLAVDFPAMEIASLGSSLKICLLAEGKADLYPRLGPTSEWDTAAAHGVLRAAGGAIVDLQFRELRYNRGPEVLNPWFLALADPAYPWRKYFGRE